jgi:acylphosphatase
MEEENRADVRLHAFVMGRVQGVNFRSATVEAARALGLTGWVANCRDGRTVEVVAEGPRPALEELLAFLHQGPPAARVGRVEANWEPARGDFTRFGVRFL